MAYTYKKRVNTNTKHSINYQNNNPFEKNPSTGGNCTWWAWGRFKEVYKDATGKVLTWTAGAGDACSFYKIMSKAGYKTGKTPKPGAIICWGYHDLAGLLVLWPIEELLRVLAISLVIIVTISMALFIIK